MEQINKHARTIAIVFLPVLWLAAVVLVLNITSPVTVGPAGILAVFLLFYCFAASLTYVLIRSAVGLWRIVGRSKVFGRKQSAYLAAVIALGPVFLGALNTLGQIGIIEVILVIALVGLACFYALRRLAD